MDPDLGQLGGEKIWVSRFHSDFPLISAKSRGEAGLRPIQGGSSTYIDVSWWSRGRLKFSQPQQ